MDLIEGLTAKLGIDGDQAKALAGAVMQKVQGEVKDRVGPAEADELAASVPELGDWAGKAKELLGSASSDDSDAGGGAGLLGSLGGAGDLLGAVTGGSGGGFDLASITSLFGKLNLDLGQITSLAPMVLSFLKSRLPDGLMAKITAAIPLLSGGGAEDSSLGGTLGKLLG